MHYCIREVDGCDPDTAAIIARLHLSVFPGEVPVNTSRGYWWLAWNGDNDRPIAFAGLWPSVRFANAGYLCRAGVACTHRGNGLQRRLIRARERKARSLGWRWLMTDTVPYNPASANSLIHCGYRLYVPAQPWCVNGAIYWRRNLNGEHA